MSYALTLCDLDGSLIATIPDATILPRFLHIAAGAIQLSDSDTPGDSLPAGDHVTTFRRVASSVWCDDDRNALFVRCVTW